MSLDLVQMVLVTVLAAATPLIIAALGELVTERAGVLNLGVEGMMVCGAAVGFAAAVESGSTLVGALAGIGAGMGLSALFGLLTVGLAANQVASGLALTIMGLGLSGLVGAGYVGLKREPAPHLYLPVLSDLPGIGCLVFGQDGFVYAGIALAIGTATPRTVRVVCAAPPPNPTSTPAAPVRIRCRAAWYVAQPPTMTGTSSS